MKEREVENYTIDYHIDDLIEVYSKRWAMKWLDKYHPEVMDRARRELTKLAEIEDGDVEKFCEALNKPTK